MKKKTKQNVVVEKLARICWNGRNCKGNGWLGKDWNTNGWTKPSGPQGKSTSLDTFECKNGYGFEEWLQDSTAIMSDGYQYAFLQQLNKGNLHVGKTYNIHLFTLSPYRYPNNGKKVRLYLGYINNAEVLKSGQQNNVFNTCMSNGRLQRMDKEVSAVNGKWDPQGGPQKTSPREVFNVRFKPEDITIFPKAKVIDPDCIGNNRYVLMNLIPLPYYTDPSTGKQPTVTII